MLITGRQIRAARALLDWDYAQFCKRTGLHRQTIRHIESGDHQPHAASFECIAQVLADAGVEFLEHNGVRLKPTNIDLLTGNEGLQKFFDGVYEYSRQHGGTIMQFGVDEQTFLTHLGAEFSRNYLDRMTKLSHERKDLHVHAIICEGDTKFLASGYNLYRWISKDIFQAVPFYIYGDRLAIMDFQTLPGPTIVLVKSRSIAAAYRKQFEAFWKMAHTPPSAPHARPGRKLSKK